MPMAHRSNACFIGFGYLWLKCLSCKTERKPLTACDHAGDDVLDLVGLLFGDLVKKEVLAGKVGLDPDDAGCRQFLKRTKQFLPISGLHKTDALMNRR